MYNTLVLSCDACSNSGTGKDLQENLPRGKVVIDVTRFKMRWHNTESGTTTLTDRHDPAVNHKMHLK